MAEPGNRPGPASLEGTDLRIGIVRARWNEELVDRLGQAARDVLDRAGVAQIIDRRVPGSFELPMAAQIMARSGQVDAVVCLGVIIRGETAHYELVSEHCARGIQDVQLRTGIPVAFGVLSVENESQARERSAPDGPNAGADAAAVAVEMARMAAEFAPGGR